MSDITNRYGTGYQSKEVVIQNPANLSDGVRLNPTTRPGRQWPPKGSRVDAEAGVHPGEAGAAARGETLAQNLPVFEESPANKFPEDISADCDPLYGSDAPKGSESSVKDALAPAREKAPKDQTTLPAVRPKHPFAAIAPIAPDEADRLADEFLTVFNDEGAVPEDVAEAAKNSKLSKGQLRFIKEWVDGGDGQAAVAFQAAGVTNGPGRLMMQHPVVRVVIDKLYQMGKAPSRVMDEEEIKETITQITRDAAMSPKDKAAACKIFADITGMTRSGGTGGASIQIVQVNTNFPKFTPEGEIINV